MLLQKLTDLKTAFVRCVSRGCASVFLFIKRSVQCSRPESRHDPQGDFCWKGFFFSRGCAKMPLKRWNPTVHSGPNRTVIFSHKRPMPQTWKGGPRYDFIWWDEVAAQNNSVKFLFFLLKKSMGRWYSYPLHVHIVFGMVGNGLCCVNFERDIVDTLCHASRRSDTTRPNNVDFLLQEGRSRKSWNTILA